jgi:hypothetical protein
LSFKHQYWIKDLHLDNVLVFLISNYEHFCLTEKGSPEDPSKNDLTTLLLLSKIYNKMVHEELHLRLGNLLQIRQPRMEYADQEKISMERVDMATMAFIHYRLHPAMLVRCLGEEYVCASRYITRIIVIARLGPFLYATDVEHIRQILTIKKGCPSRLQFKGERESKWAVIRKGNKLNIRR